MAEFAQYEVEYTNVKPWHGMNAGSGKAVVGIVKSSSSTKAKLKKALEQKLNSLGVRVDSYREVGSSAE